MQPSSKRTLGIVLLVLSLVALPVAFCQVTPIGFVDFPCLGQQIDLENISSDTRLAYCVSIWPRQAISGGGIYDYGTSNQDEIRVDPFVFRREDLTLFVNNHPIKPGETYTTTRYSVLNPWVVLTSRFELKNDGPLSEQSSLSASVLSGSGDVYEGWFPNPLGFIILGYGKK
jgi:hypothetical protein